MSALVRSSTAVAVTGFAIATLTAAPVPPTQSPLTVPHLTVSQDVRLAAATTPPGGLITGFLGNQVLYCSLICTSAIQGAVTVTGVALQTPATFVAALQSGDLIKAIGVTAASVTGAADAAAADVIFKDGMEVAPRVLNAFEVGVVGLLNVAPAAAGGLPGVLRALETARDDTFTAMNLPIVPNPTPTVMPHGVLQVAVIGAINVGAAVIFPALNDVLLGAFQVPDAVARTLAQTGDPLRAVGAGVATVATVARAASHVIAQSVATAVANVRTAIGQSQKSAPATTPARAAVEPSTKSVSTTKHAVAAPASPRPGHAGVSKVSNVRSAVHTVVKKATDRPHHQHA
jgi:hypothetical protein